MTQRLLVVGATGDVGQGVVSAALETGRKVVAAGRRAERLARLSASHPGETFAAVVGDVATEAGAQTLWDQAAAVYGGVDAVVVAVNAPNRLSPLADWTAEDLSAVIASNLLTHFIAAKTFLPRLPAQGVLLGVGGGTADFVIPKLAYLSMTLAAQRMMYRGFARERKGGAEIRELMVISMVNGESKRDRAEPDWLTDVEVGRHVCAILDAPGAFPGPILQLKSRDQVGRPETAVGA